MRGMQFNVEFVYQLSICSKDREKSRKILIELVGRSSSEYLRIKTVPQREHHTSQLQR
jgi:hypothetical protein